MSEQTIKPVENRQPNGKFGPGNIANPNGRPKKEHALTEILNDMMTADPNIKKALITRLIKIALYSKDEDTVIKAIDKIWERTDGKPVQLTELAVKNNQPVLLLESNGSTVHYTIGTTGQTDSQSGSTDATSTEAATGDQNPPESAV